MRFLETNIKDLIVIEPTVFPDERGYFFESFSAQKMEAEGLSYNWVQDNEAKSQRGVLRGLHYQIGASAQTKLVRVTQGEVLDVVLDLREDSETYGKSFTLIMNELNKKQLLIPRGFAHGYVVLSDSAIFSYKCDNFYNKDMEGGIKYNDPSLGINWIIDSSELIVSVKDMSLPVMGEHRKI